MQNRPEPSLNPEAANAQALVQVYQEHITLVYRYIYSRVGNREDAEDLTSQVFVKAVRHLDTSRDPMMIRSWLFRLAKTTMADYWREYYRAPKVALELVANRAEEETQPVAENSTSVETLRQVLDELPQHYRQVLTLRFLEGLSLKETAAEMGITEGNVKVLQLRALRRAAERGAHLL